MNIILSSEDYSRSFVLRLTGQRRWLALGIAAAIFGVVIYAAARAIAVSWIENEKPIAQKLVAEARDRAEKNRRELWRQATGQMGGEIAKLHVRLWRLTRLGLDIAGRLGLPTEEFPEAEGLMLGEDSPTENSPTSPPPTETDSDSNSPDDSSKAPAESAAEISSELILLDEATERITHKFSALASAFSSREAKRNTIPDPRPLASPNWRASGYGYRRDPFTGRRAFHSGYDYAAKRGSVVFAAADGVVVYRGRLGNYGNTLEIYHGDGVSTLYGHLHAYEAEPLQFVKKGDSVGRVGSTGRSTGPHLHFEVRLQNRPRRPSKVIKELQRARLAEGGN